MSDSDVFIVSIVQHADPSEAIRQAIGKAGVNASRVQDVVFGLDKPHSIETNKILSTSALNCSTAVVTPGLRSSFFAAQSILAGDADVVIVLGLGDDVPTAILLASPDAVGRWNLMPGARLAARSLTGAASALRTAGIELKDVNVTKDGRNGVALVREAVEELERQSARWGMVTSGNLALLIERI